MRGYYNRFTAATNYQVLVYFHHLFKIKYLEGYESNKCNAIFPTRVSKTTLALSLDGFITGYVEISKLFTGKLWPCLLFA